MSYESRAYDDHHGDPVVVLVVTGTHDVSRLANLMAGDRNALCEHLALAAQIKRQLRRHGGGRAALQLLAAHGGPDLLHEVPATDRQLVDAIAQAIGDPGSIVGRKLGPSWGKGNAGYADTEETVTRWATRAVMQVLRHSGWQRVAPGETVIKTADVDDMLCGRDDYREWADRLAEAIAGHLGVEIGEHTSDNNPWQNALETIEGATALDRAGRAS